MLDVLPSSRWKAIRTLSLACVSCENVLKLNVFSSFFIYVSDLLVESLHKFEFLSPQLLDLLKGFSFDFIDYSQCIITQINLLVSFELEERTVQVLRNIFLSELACLIFLRWKEPWFRSHDVRMRNVPWVLVLFASNYRHVRNEILRLWYLLNLLWSEWSFNLIRSVWLVQWGLIRAVRNGLLHIECSLGDVLMWLGSSKDRRILHQKIINFSLLAYYLTEFALYISVFVRT